MNWVFKNTRVLIDLVQNKPCHVIEKNSPLILVIVELHLARKPNQFILIQDITIQIQIKNAIQTLTEHNKKATHVNAKITGTWYVQYFHNLPVLFIHHCDNILVFQVDLRVIAFDLVNFARKIESILVLKMY